MTRSPLRISDKKLQVIFKLFSSEKDYLFDIMAQSNDILQKGFIKQRIDITLESIADLEKQRQKVLRMKPEKEEELRLLSEKEAASDFQSQLSVVCEKEMALLAEQADIQVQLAILNDTKSDIASKLHAFKAGKAELNGVLASYTEANDNILALLQYEYKGLKLCKAMLKKLDGKGAEDDEVEDEEEEEVEDEEEEEVVARDVVEENDDEKDEGIPLFSYTPWTL